MADLAEYFDAVTADLDRMVAGARQVAGGHDLLTASTRVTAGLLAQDLDSRTLSAMLGLALLRLAARTEGSRTDG